MNCERRAYTYNLWRWVLLPVMWQWSGTNFYSKKGRNFNSDLATKDIKIDGNIDSSFLGIMRFNKSFYHPWYPYGKCALLKYFRLSRKKNWYKYMKRSIACELDLAIRFFFFYKQNKCCALQNLNLTFPKIQKKSCLNLENNNKNNSGMRIKLLHLSVLGLGNRYQVDYMIMLLA